MSTHPLNLEEGNEIIKNLLRKLTIDQKVIQCFLTILAEGTPIRKVEILFLQVVQDKYFILYHQIGKECNLKDKVFNQNLLIPF